MEIDALTFWSHFLKMTPGRVVESQKNVHDVQVAKDLSQQLKLVSCFVYFELLCGVGLSCFVSKRFFSFRFFQACGSAEDLVHRLEVRSAASRELKEKTDGLTSVNAYLTSKVSRLKEELDTVKSELTSSADLRKQLADVQAKLLSAESEVGLLKQKEIDNGILLGKAKTDYDTLAVERNALLRDKATLVAEKQRLETVVDRALDAERQIRDYVMDQCYSVRRLVTDVVHAVGGEPLPLVDHGQDMSFDLFFRWLREEVAALPGTLEAFNDYVAFACFKQLLDILRARGCQHNQDFESPRFKVVPENLVAEVTDDSREVLKTLVKRIWRKHGSPFAKELVLGRMAKVPCVVLLFFLVSFFSYIFHQTFYLFSCLFLMRTTGR